MQDIINYLKYGEYGKQLIKLVIIILIILVTIGAVRVIKRIMKREKFQSSLHYKLIGNLAIIVVYFIGIMTIIGQFPQLGSLVKTLLAGSGILALAISLSAQESLNNILSGLFITMFKPFEAGDRIKMVSSNITGIVEDITFRHTVIRTFTNTRIVVPNSTMNKEVIENSNLIDSRASAFVDITVSYESDIHKAMKIIAEEIGNHPLYLDVRTDEEIKSGKQKVEVFARELGANGICLRANMWTSTVSESFGACSDVRLSIKERFDQENIEIPYNKLVISNLHNDSRAGGTYNE